MTNNYKEITRSVVQIRLLFLQIEIQVCQTFAHSVSPRGIYNSKYSCVLFLYSQANCKPKKKPEATFVLLVASLMLKDSFGFIVSFFLNFESKQKS